jgi:hypothetical protein
MLAPTLLLCYEVYDQALTYLGSTVARSPTMAVEYFAHRGARYATAQKPPTPVVCRPAGPFDHCMTPSRFD